MIQRVHPQVEFELSYQEAGEERVAEIMSDFIRPFDLKRAPLLRAGLIKISDFKYLLMYDLHHIISDMGHRRSY